MIDTNSNAFEDNDLLFYKDEDLSQNRREDEKWRILIVDDEESVHKISKLVLKNFIYNEKPLDILFASSYAEAVVILNEYTNIALAILDVVMEEEDSGLKLVKYIRDQQCNKMMRIILRTGQPGQAPERKVILEYDINDYKLKNELTSDRFFVSVVTALRGYNDIMILSNNKLSLEKIIDTSTTLFKETNYEEFMKQILPKLTIVLKNSKSSINISTSGFTAIKAKDSFIIESAIGSYVPHIKQNLSEVVDPNVQKSLQNAINAKKTIFEDNSFLSYLENKTGKESLIFLSPIDSINEFDRNMVEIFCHNVGIALDNIFLNKEVEMTQKEIIFTLGEIAESRSNETGHHVKRVAEYSKLLALKCGLTEEESEIIRMASPMHDVGKLAIPDIILNKPGKLTPEEFSVMKTHSQVGYDMLRNSNKGIMKVAAIIALQHHEKYDGSGYPNKLAQEDINLYGRITAIADVFDALSVERVYKKAWELDSILDLFRQERGKHFDPHLVDILFDNLEEIILIRDRFSDKFLLRG